MIYVDYREGSKHLKSPLLARGVPAEITDLPFGDVAFEGRGIGDKPVQIGIELKRLTGGDLVTSLRSGRLEDHQIPGMIGPKGMYDWAFLIVEGAYRVNKAGQLITLGRQGWRPVQGRMHVAEMEKRLLTLELCAGVHIRFTNREEDTTTTIVNLYRWWTDKSFDQHRSQYTLQHPTSLVPLSDFRATLMVRCPGMGLAASLAAELRFKGNLKKAAMATADDWGAIQTIDRKGSTKRLGLAKGREIAEFWNAHG